ncbi:hypothetical protein IWQ60_001631, partial [Tieghemiomyces parasiticus]
SRRALRVIVDDEHDTTTPQVGRKVTLKRRRPTDTISFDIAPVTSERPAVPPTPETAHGPSTYGLAQPARPRPLGSGREIRRRSSEKDGQVTLANVDHWAALVSDDIFSEDDDPVVTSSLTSPPLLPSVHPSSSARSHAPSQESGAPAAEAEPERKQRLPVQRRQKQIDEDNRRQRYQQEIAQMAELRRQRQEAFQERERQNQEVLGVMAEKRMIMNFEKQLPRDRDWDRMERERLRLIHTVLGVRPAGRQTPGSVPLTPNPAYAATSPLPDTPLGFMPGSPMPNSVSNLPPSTASTAPTRVTAPSGNDDVKGKYLHYAATHPPPESGRQSPAASVTATTATMPPTPVPVAAVTANGPTATSPTSPDASPTDRPAYVPAVSHVDHSALRQTAPLVATGPIAEVEMDVDDTEEGELSE